MSSKKNNERLTNIIISIAMLILGVLFCALRSQFVSALITVIGAMLIVYGIYQIIKKQYLEGALECVIGIGIIAMGWTIVDISLLILGILLVVYAIYLIITTLPLIKSANGQKLFNMLSTPMLSLVLGIILIVARWYMIDALFIALGAILIASGGVILIKTVMKEK